MSENTIPLPSIERNTAKQVRQSYAQSRLWFLHQIEPDQGQYNILVRISLKGPALNIVKIKAALQLFVENHNVLCTRYNNTPSGPQQQVMSIEEFYGEQPKELPLQIIDFSQLTQNQQQSTLDAWIKEERSKPFDLKKGPVFRPYIIKLSEDRQEIGITIHHIAFDGRSGEIFLVDMAEIYSTGKLNAKPFQYADFSAWEPRFVTPQFIEQEIDFWRHYLSDIPQNINFPKRQGLSNKNCSATHCFTLSSEVIKNLKNSSKKYKKTIYKSLLTLFGLWVSYLSNQKRFLIGTDIHGRNIPELANIMGFFVNQMIIKYDLSNKKTVLETLSDTNQSVKSALAHNRIPFDVLVSELSPARTTNSPPFFQVKFNYQPNRFVEKKFGDAEIINAEVIQELANFDLVMDLVHGKKSIDVKLEYNQRLFSTEDIKRLSELWVILVVKLEDIINLTIDEALDWLKQLESKSLLDKQAETVISKRPKIKKSPRKPISM